MNNSLSFIFDSHENPKHFEPAGNLDDLALVQSQYYNSNVVSAHLVGEYLDDGQPNLDFESIFDENLLSQLEDIINSSEFNSRLFDLSDDQDMCK